jgi:hypothetical protein
MWCFLFGVKLVSFSGWDFQHFYGASIHVITQLFLCAQQWIRRLSRVVLCHVLLSWFYGSRFHWIERRVDNGYMSTGWKVSVATKNVKTEHRIPWSSHRIPFVWQVESFISDYIIGTFNWNVLYSKVYLTRCTHGKLVFAFRMVVC